MSMAHLTACARKDGYDTKAEARAEIVRRGWKRTAKAYRCMFCDRYHIGHKTPACNRRGEKGTR